MRIFLELIVLFTIHFHCLKTHPNRDNKIYNGYTVDPHKNTFMAYIWTTIPDGNSSYSKSCGGTIIDSHWILTAAHCFKRDRPDGDVDLDNYNVSQIKIVVGSDNYSPFDETHQRLNVSNIYNPLETINVEVNFTGELKRYLINDIALVRLSSPIRFDNATSKIHLVKNESFLQNWQTFYTGWGDISSTQDQAEPLQEMIIEKFVMDDVCMKDFKESVWQIGARDYGMCADKKNASMCQADSGGPLFARLGDSVAVQIGIGRAALPIAECSFQGNRTQLFTRVSQHCAWIAEITNLPNICDSLNVA